MIWLQGVDWRDNGCWLLVLLPSLVFQVLREGRRVLLRGECRIRSSLGAGEWESGTLARRSDQQQEQQAVKAALLPAEERKTQKTGRMERKRIDNTTTSIKIGNLEN